ncbi:MAG: hypothetical protein V7735_12905, partial [Photobacterium frigidiphilum]|uniref:hypothetical protein n=1 Tax=Photobacterium frigidiphilum TaxID=264736 RepID=UPI003001BAB0
MAVKLKKKERQKLKAESSTEMIVREENTKRKKKSTGKRKGSGLMPKSIYLHESTYNRFEELAKSFGYQLGTKGLSSEQLSMLVHFLLDAYKNTERICVPLTYDGQYLYRTHNILKYRSKTMRDTTKELAEFMVECKYPVPKKFATLDRNKSKYFWTENIVQCLLDTELVSEQIEKLNQSSNSFPYNNKHNAAIAHYGDELDAPFDPDFDDELDAPFDPDFDDELDAPFDPDFDDELDAPFD